MNFWSSHVDCPAFPSYWKVEDVQYINYEKDGRNAPRWDPSAAILVSTA